MRELGHFRTSSYFSITKLNLKLSYSFYVPCIVFVNVHLKVVLPMFLFLLNKLQSKAGAVNQIIHPCFCKRSTLDKLNVQAATPEMGKNNINCVTKYG